MWTEQNKRIVRAVIDAAAAKLVGGKAELARLLGTDSRAVLGNWHKRGRVPIEYHEKLIRLAAPEMNATPAMLHPLAAAVTKTQQRTEGLAEGMMG